MRALLNRLKEVNAGAFIVMSILLLALLLNGANNAAGAALLSLALLALLFATIFMTSTRRLWRTLRANWISVLAALAFVALAIVTALVAPQSMQASPLWSIVGNAEAPLSLAPYRTFEGVVALCAPLSAFLLGALYAPDRAARDWAGRWAITLGALYSFAGLYLFYAVGGSPRLDVEVGSANAAAAFFGTLMVIAATLIARGARGRLGETNPALDHWGWGVGRLVLSAPFAFAVLLALFACLLLTASRGGLVASSVALIILVSALWAQSMTQGRARGAVALAPIGLVIAVLALLFVRGGEDVLARFALAGDDWEVRRVLADAHYAQFLERPLLGHGLNSYHELNTLAITPENWRMLAPPGSAHNIFIQSLEETGIAGLALWVLMVAPILVRALRRLARGEGGVEWAAAALAMSVLLLLHGLVDFALQVPAIAAFYAFMLGASVGAPRR